jgi:hypothetical protein
MELLVIIPLIALAIGGLIEGRGQKRAAREVAAMRRRGELPPRQKVDSWEGSAEQKQLRAAGEMRRWDSQPPY